MNTSQDPFRTTFGIAAPLQRIGLPDRLFSIGSCFSDHIGGLLQAHKFRILSNPFGVIFDPLSIFGALRMALGEAQVQEGLYVEQEGVWRHFQFHSDVHAYTEAALREALQAQCAAAGAQLRQSRFLLLTVGTAFVFRELESGQVVANCHKQPARRFGQELLSPEQIAQDFGALLPLLPPDMQVVLTVSPVRHTRNGMPDNQLSKSILRYACHLMQQQAPERVHYFPAYELLMDDLRDYRFYAEDMVHPSTQAVRYVWERFAACWLDGAAQDFLPRWEKILRALSHRPFHPHTPAHQQFLQKLLLQLTELSAVVDVDQELAQVREQLLP